MKVIRYILGLILGIISAALTLYFICGCIGLIIYGFNYLFNI